MSRRLLVPRVKSFWRWGFLVGVSIVLACTIVYLVRDMPEERAIDTIDSRLLGPSAKGGGLHILEGDVSEGVTAISPYNELRPARTSDGASDDRKPPSQVESGPASEWDGSLSEVLAKHNLEQNITSAASLLGVHLEIPARLSERFAPSPRFKCIQTADQKEFTFTAKGVFLTYIDASAENIPDELMHLDAFTKDEALQTVHAALAALGIDVDDRKFWMKLVDNGGYTSDDLRGSSYEFGMGLSYKDYRTIAMVKARVSTYTGKVKSISTIPLVIPESLELKLTEQDALRLARKFSAEKNFPVIAFNIDSEKWIVSPNPQVWTGPPFWGPDYDAARVVYRVYAEGNFKGYLDIDGIAGEIVGGTLEPEHQHLRR